MSEHWNVQIKVQRVTNERVNGAAKEREVTEVLSLAVVADSEREACAKARRILDVQTGGE